MGLVLVDFWDIVDEYEESPPFNTNPKVKRDHKRCVKIVSIVALSFTDNFIVVLYIYD
jgi:hypothetical protein